MKKILGLSLVTAIALSTHALAEFKTSGSATLTTNVLFRGVSLSNHAGATQENTNAYTGIASLGIEYKGVHFEAYDFNELDTTLGFANEVGKFSYDLGLNNYDYGSNKENDLEAYLLTSYKSFVTVGLNYYYGLTGVTTNMLELSVEKEFKELATFAMVYGLSFDTSAYDNYYGLSATRPLEILKGWDLELGIQQSEKAGADMLWSVALTKNF